MIDTIWYERHDLVYTTRCIKYDSICYLEQFTSRRSRELTTLPVGWTNLLPIAAWRNRSSLSLSLSSLSLWPLSVDLDFYRGLDNGEELRGTRSELRRITKEELLFIKCNEWKKNERWMNDEWTTNERWMNDEWTMNERLVNDEGDMNERWIFVISSSMPRCWLTQTIEIRWTVEI